MQHMKKYDYYAHMHPCVTDLELIAKFGKTDRQLDLDILGRMSELSLFKRKLMIDKCTDPKKLRRHIQYWNQKFENLTNDSLELNKDRKYVAMFQHLVEHTTDELDEVIEVTNTKKKKDS